MAPITCNTSFRYISITCNAFIACYNYMLTRYSQPWRAPRTCPPLKPCFPKLLHLSAPPLFHVVCIPFCKPQTQLKPCPLPSPHHFTNHIGAYSSSRPRPTIFPFYQNVLLCFVFKYLKDFLWGFNLLGKF